ncbi:hypothetical protein [Amycolatopsis sp. MtRt-6]|uniref:hypothetical protein n=1 Tax=Amycolatopsis sp. MtRt-6 TaxID=2792782 RepID=UPI001A8DA34E|nr:hypothetical protein [Amycolatopsis sp. MtRt-6]
MHVELTAVAEADKPVLANLLQLYQYDFSEIRELDLTPHGTFTYRYLDPYFTESGREAYFITVDHTLAGFALLRNDVDDGGHPAPIHRLGPVSKSSRTGFPARLRRGVGNRRSTGLCCVVVGSVDSPRFGCPAVVSGVLGCGQRLYLLFPPHRVMTLCSIAGSLEI